MNNNKTLVLDIIFKYKLPRLTKKTLNYGVSFILNKINPSPLFLYIYIINNRKMKFFNLTWRKINKTTDVLTFATEEISVYKKYWNYMLGDLVLSIDKIIYHSHLLGIYIYEEMSILILHGFLHLLNFNHSKGCYNYILQKIVELKCLNILNIKQDKSLYVRSCKY